MLEAPLLARLGRDTASHHAGADADIDRFLFGPRTTADDYQCYLARIYGFLAPLEASLAIAPGLEGVIDVRERAKAPLVAQDLVALGTPWPHIASLPQCLAIPAFRGPAAALGWLYVAERPMLAAAVIARHLETRLPEQMDRGASYLGCYSGQVAARWCELGDAIERVAATEAIAERIVDASLDAFRTLRRWRVRDLDQVRYAV